MHPPTYALSGGVSLIYVNSGWASRELDGDFAPPLRDRVGEGGCHGEEPEAG